MSLMEMPRPSSRAPGRVPVFATATRWFGILWIVIACNIISALVGEGILAWRIDRSYEHTHCIVVPAKRNESASRGSYPAVYEYQLGGRSYRSSKFDFMAYLVPEFDPHAQLPIQFVLGRTYDCWFDPKHPESAVLTRELKFDWSIMLFQGLCGLGSFAFGFSTAAGFIKFTIPRSAAGAA